MTSPNTANRHSETLNKIKLACELSVSGKSVKESIQTIGKGWIGEEALVNHWGYFGSLAWY